MTLADVDLGTTADAHSSGSRVQLRGRWRHWMALARQAENELPAAANDGLCPSSGVAAKAWGLSLVTHAVVLLLPAWWWRHAPPTPPEPQAILVELSAVQSLHAQEALAPRATPAPPHPPQAPVPKAPRAERMLTARADSPVKVPMAEPVPPTDAVPPPDTSHTAAAPAQEGADANRIRQAQTAESEAQAQLEAMRRYLSQLKKAVQAHLVYPPEAKASGSIGSPMVTFQLSEEGQIVGGSLRLQRSSGVSSLDENALAAVQASAPLPRPPKAMTVALAISFVRDP